MEERESGSKILVEISFGELARLANGSAKSSTCSPILGFDWPSIILADDGRPKYSTWRANQEAREGAAAGKESSSFPRPEDSSFHVRRGLVYFPLSPLPPSRGKKE